MTLEEYKKEVDKNINSLFEKASNEEKDLLNAMIKVINDLSQEKQFLIDYLKGQINQCDKEIERFSKNYNVYFAQIENLKVTKKNYEEFLSKTEKE